MFAGRSRPIHARPWKRGRSPGISHCTALKIRRVSGSTAPTQGSAVRARGHVDGARVAELADIEIALTIGASPSRAGTLRARLRRIVLRRGTARVGGAASGAGSFSARVPAIGRDSSGSWRAFNDIRGCCPASRSSIAKHRSSPRRSEPSGRASASLLEQLKASCRVRPRSSKVLDQNRRPRTREEKRVSVLFLDITVPNLSGIWNRGA